eukprot:TRINITY_DN3237_c0_g1_i4.p1 TRINITY_DN3237_c0_g1~~TRINITY_DN3237_c0_g1_i4.p1  ORF type:complete len:324 (+),score=61.62 TRINITY_DN3237_c0_g1_i4:277-1248(+)
MFTDDCVRVNGEVVDKKYKVREGDNISLDPPIDIHAPVPAEDVKLNIIFEDEYILVLNKPAGTPMHPSKGFRHGTVAGGLLFRLYHKTGLVGDPNITEEAAGGTGLVNSYASAPSTGIVHRLDINTSGVCVTAKQFDAAVYLRKQFLGHTTKKVYLALCHGVPEQDHFSYQCNIYKPKGKGSAMACAPLGSEQGLPSDTDFELVERSPCGRYSLVRCFLHTGRTHQIRLHLSKLGLPLVGDRMYGNVHGKYIVERQQETGSKSRKRHSGKGKPEFFEVKRHMLHACRLQFVHPGKHELETFEASLPSEFEAALDAARKGLRLF